MRTDEILKHLSREHLSDSLGLFIDVFSELDMEDIKKKNYYKNDGFDIIRYIIESFDGINFKVPSVKNMRNLIEKYLEERKLEVPGISVVRLAHETGLSEKTIKEYLKANKI